VLCACGGGKTTAVIEEPAVIDASAFIDEPTTNPLRTRM